MMFQFLKTIGFIFCLFLFQHNSIAFDYPSMDFAANKLSYLNWPLSNQNFYINEFDRGLLNHTCTFVIYKSQFKSEIDLQQRVAKLFQFPDYYGFNLDALYDLLTEDRYFQNVTLCIEKSSSIADLRWELWLEVFNDARMENPKAPQLILL